MIVHVRNNDLSEAVRIFKRKLNKDPVVSPLQLIPKRSERMKEKRRRAEVRRRKRQARMMGNRRDVDA